MRRLIRRYLDRRYCKRNGHGIGCEIEVFRFAPGVLYDSHTHICPRCGMVTLTETKPLDPNLRAMYRRGGKVS